MATPEVSTPDARDKRKLRKTTTKAHRKALQQAKIGRNDMDDVSTSSCSNVVASALSMTSTMSGGSRSVLASKKGRKLIVLRKSASIDSSINGDMTSAEEQVCKSNTPKSRARKLVRESSSISGAGVKNGERSARKISSRRNSRSRGVELAREVTSEMQWPASEAQWSGTSLDSYTSASDTQRRHSLSRGEPVRLVTSSQQAGVNALPRFSVSLFETDDVTSVEDSRQVLSERASGGRHEFGYPSNVVACDAPPSARSSQKKSKIFAQHASITSQKVLQELRQTPTFFEDRDVITRDVITTHLFHDPTFVQPERTSYRLPKVSDRERYALVKCLLSSTTRS